MTPEDLQDMTRRLAQEELLDAAGFEPLPEDGGELWIRDLELYTRSRALVSALEELVLAGERGARSFAVSLTKCNDGTVNDERRKRI